MVTPPLQRKSGISWSLRALQYLLQSKMAPCAVFRGLVDMFQESELTSPLPVASCQPFSLRPGFSARLGGIYWLCLAIFNSGEGIENFALHNQSSTNKPDTLPKLVQFSVCMLYSSEPLGQGEEGSSKGEDSRAEPHPGLPTITLRLSIC